MEESEESRKFWISATLGWNNNSTFQTKGALALGVRGAGTKQAEIGRQGAPNLTE